MLAIKITNEEKFNQVDDVDFSGASNSIFNGAFDGNVFIKLKNGEEFDITGEHWYKDWEEEFGFIVVDEEEEKNGPI